MGLQYLYNMCMYIGFVLWYTGVDPGEGGGRTRRVPPPPKIVYQLRNFFIPKIIVDFRTDLHKMKIKHRIIDEYAPKRCFFD
jgi:hypothetical protein